jgi:hypothetical protein
MPNADHADLTVTLDDLLEHVVRYGVDIFPPVDFRTELTRAQDLFSRLHEKWPAYYRELDFAPENNQFRAFTTWSQAGGTARCPSLAIVPRGPVFMYPLRLPPPLGEIQHSLDLDGLFMDSLRQLRKTFPGREVLRAGLVRHLVFSTGRTSSVSYINSRFGTFLHSSPTGGEATITFQDGTCNLRARLSTTEIRHEQRLPLTGQVLQVESEYGIKVEFDVNNVQLRPMQEPEIGIVLQRAHSLWPKELIAFINSPASR